MNLSQDLAETLDRLIALPTPQRAALAQGLLLSLDEDDVLDDAGDWSAELDARLVAVERGDYAPGDWRDVIARIRDDLVKREAP